MQTFSESRFLQTPVVGILRGYTQAEVLQIAEIYQGAGFTNIEITMNTPNALAIIERLAEQYAGKLNVGAGTVLTIEVVDAVLVAGGQFIVSPVTDVDLIRYCTSKNIPVFPGAYTPTEIYQAWQAGARMVKVFPARDLGPTYIKDVLAPLDQLELMPTGGVTLENLEAYLEAGAKAFGMGGYLFDQALIEQENWEALRQHFDVFRKATIRS
ncbi:MAG: bifunctional 4-hydroxy-2-oxoglutarate aldolase/2-dehydro-3-deoxy-phosphogluconate aldolase [Bacteroidota bacterium]